MKKISEDDTKSKSGEFGVTISEPGEFGVPPNISAIS